MKKIAIYGGSFNPPHSGHIHITRLALYHLDVDEVWWIVANNNPFKDPSIYADFSVREELCKKITQYNPKIKVMDIEKQQNYTDTCDTVEYILKTYPEHKFCWIMGSDNLPHFHLWRNYQEIAANIPIVVFQRYLYNNINEFEFCKKYHKSRIPDHLAKHIFHMPTPVWCFMNHSLDNSSSTKIRRTSDQPFQI